MGGAQDEMEATARMTTFPVVAEDISGAGPQFFALIHGGDPNRVCYFGIDVGDGAFTVRRDPVTGHTNFGSWNSMESALERLDQLNGANGHMTLVVFDSVPVAAVRALMESDPSTRAIPTAISETDGGER
jgi:hypothetical protein